ncbi:hypothetical protein [Lacinutrix jangbogonensis]|uniref:hypothetical protein n=1 Tax=Lacinutrix jangbogonensis TaxID=1469557 RepID=UPI00053E4438|nr:hypothetical protein [Lacinutrix jangbogonensis]
MVIKGFQKNNINIIKNIIVVLIVFVLMPFHSFSQDVTPSKKEKKRQNNQVKKQKKQANSHNNKTLNWLAVIDKPMDSDEVKQLFNTLGTPSELKDNDKLT